jgi:two-component system sensor histidine kinase BaeS
MTGPAEDGSASAAADDAARGAARERQAHVRHELRAPLAVIYPLLSLLADGADRLSPEQREFLNVLERNVVRLEALIVGVADSGWADCSAAEAIPGEVALADIAEEVVALRAVDEQAGPAVVIEAGPPPSPCAWADRDDLRQIVADLVRNAATYIPSDGRVSIRIAAGADPDTVTLEVEDTGPGMTPEELSRAFEFGFRGEQATRLRAPGLGAGLWVCRELAVRNGGSITLAGEPGGGVRATLTLPAAAREKP